MSCECLNKLINDTYSSVVSSMMSYVCRETNKLLLSNQLFLDKSFILMERTFICGPLCGRVNIRYLDKSLPINRDHMTIIATCLKYFSYFDLLTYCVYRDLNNNSYNSV